MVEIQEDALIGKEIDGFRILGVLGRGGMGVVYKAEDVALSRTVALKVIDPALARDAAFVRRFRTEARALASVQSMYIVNIHALRQTEVGMFIVMEYVDGGTLADLIDEGPITWKRAYPILRQMLLAFEQAHSVGVIHRDIKPRNIMLSRDGVVKVTDFGLAKLRDTDRASTVTQGTAGTLFYMSPEQIKGRHDIDHRSDIYSLGMTIYEMFAGRLPFDRSASDFTIMRTIVENKLPSPAQFRPELPPAIARVVMRALEKDPSRRYASAREFLEALEATGDRDDETAAVGLSRLQNRRHLAFAVAALLVVAAVAVGYVLFGRSPTDGVTRTSALSAEGVVPAQSGVDAMGDSAASAAGQAGGTDPSHNTVPTDGGEGSGDASSPATEEAASEGDPEPPARAATVTLRAADAGVKIVAGETSQTGRATVRLVPGSHEAIFEHPVYGQRRERFTVRAGEQVTLTYHFTGTVSIPSPLLPNGEEGPWAAIWIDGRTEADWFTPKTIELGPGSHVISVTKSNYEVLNNDQEIGITPGFERSEHSIMFRMRPE